MNLFALRRWTVLLALVPLAPLFAAPSYHPVAEAEEAAKAARPRILSEAERAAVALAVDYLQGGPEAWVGRLAGGSPWSRLGKGEAREEIAARAGPPDGATWQLLTPDNPDPDRAVFAIEFASGLDEILDLRLLDQGGWKIAAVRSTSDPWAGAPAASATSAASAGPAGEASGAPEASPTPEPGHRAGWMALLAVLIAAGGGAGAFALLRAKRKPAAIGVGAGAAALALGVVLWGFLGRSAPVAGTGAGGADPRSPAGPRLSLGALAPLRAALASGRDRGEIARLLARTPADPHLREVQELWRAQQRMAEGDLAGAEATLRAFPEASSYPLADLLRARLAFRRMRRAETGWLFEKAIRHGLDNDGLRLEAGFAEAQTDEEGHAEEALKRMVERGSRLAEPWYVTAGVAASQDRWPEAEAYLRRAWQLEPVPRANLFRSPVMAALVARPALFKVFELGLPEEARLPPEGPRHPLPLPAGVRAATCGQALRLDIAGKGNDGDSSLLVPGGAEIAPADAVLEDAATWNHHEEARAFAALPALTAQAGGGLPPRLLKLAEQAGAALAEEHRWNELVALTDPVVPLVESAPADLVRLRARALRELGREGEAKELLLRLAKTDLAGRRPATATLLDLAELYAAAGEYDVAIRLSAKADSQLAEPRGEQRRRQLAMDRDLETSYASFDTDHFEIRYPKANRERYARQVAWVLEEERTRLSRYIPLPPHPRRIEVHLFPVKDFYASFAGDVAVVGLFDGKMRVPFGEQRTLHPQIVSILSHELAHALMTDATHGQAPHWMQEGLAQHLETGVERFNPLPDLAESGRRLSFPTVDPILRGFAERQFVGLAYSEAAWAIAFVEARWGQPAIPRLLASFAAGRTTEQAIQEVTGLSLPEFDRVFWAWGTGEGPRTRSLAGRDYEGDYAELENREKLAEGGLHLGRRPDEGKVRSGMADWHARYEAKTAEVKRRLPPIYALYEKEALPLADAAACGGLAAEARKALADPEAWATPDKDVGDQLRGVYSLIADLGDACQIGQTPEARTLIKRIRVGFNRAAETLTPFGVKP